MLEQKLSDSKGVDYGIQSTKLENPASTKIAKVLSESTFYGHAPSSANINTKLKLCHRRLMNNQQQDSGVDERVKLFSMTICR